MKKTQYLTELQKKKIEKMYKAYVEEGEKVRVMFIALSVDAPAHIVREYILEEFGEGAKDNIFMSKSKYIDTREKDKDKQYIRYKDYYNLYEHQYIMQQELDITVEEVRKYVIHHKSGNKRNNNFTNLHLFYNQEMHQRYHKGKEKDVLKFTYVYIEELMENAPQEEIEVIRDYAKLLDKQIEKQKNYSSREAKSNF